ncbi:oxidoreductase [Novosphingobium album (ex Liu et al. 2023)]|uniref:Oxidoreductase n=1 Tax=Novosphingobium album (ex Liu et al. 2023) TaxID=3031130 RepID=A0ABT5WU77_9SPHN|nr:oxidoreductase [Novosphingobium album (ex Liu et al. 2023)]MDE8653432.1 oxidoreductase [Novosphingobium album (ex Liu et al. 2023)]
MATWFITGCSSGLGHALATAVLEAGFNAVVTARDAGKVKEFEEAFPGQALAVALDLNDKPSIGDAVAQATARFGDIDVLVNNAGYGYRAAIEEGDEHDVAELFATHVFGPVALMKAVLPAMRARRQGTIVNFSSIAAQFFNPGSGYYSAAKMAQEGITLTLKMEVEPLGLRVMVIEPGAFRTDFAGRSLKGVRTAIDDYADTVGPRRKENDRTDGTQPGDPTRAAKLIVETVARPRLPSRLLLGSDAVTIVRKGLNAQLAEIDAAQATSEATDFPNND